MRLNPAAFDRHLTSIGQQARWSRSYACPCVNPTSGSPDPKHALCGGKGRIWDQPLDTVVGVASQKVQAQWAQMGMYEAGDMVLSVPQSSAMWDEVSQFDRILMLNSNDVFSQPFTRGAPTERILFKPEKMTRCFWLHPQTGAIVDGKLPVFDENGRPSWPAGGEPPPGVKYSLTGFKFSEYWVWGGFPSDRNEHSGARLPKRVVARKWDLFGR
jgi:hypothetical protein